MKIQKSLRQILIISLIFLSFSTVHAAGEVDSTFTAYLAKAGLGNVYRTVVQPDGKIIISGKLGMVNGALKNTIVRLNTDGTIDTTFNTPTIVGHEVINIHAMSLQSTGKIVIAGPIISVNGVARAGIARLNADGTPDTIFNSNSSLGNIIQGFYLKVLPDDRIVFSGIKSDGTKIVARYSADGNLEAETARNAFRFDVQPDGKVVYWGPTADGVRRLNQDLTLDNTFTQVTPNNTVYLIMAQPDGKILVGGLFNQINGTPSPSLVRINSDGSVDAPFVNNLSGGGIPLLLPSGKFYLGIGAGQIILKNADGTTDPSFNASTNIPNLSELDLAPDGKIVASGSGSGDDAARPLLVRVNTDGSNDTTLQTAIGDFTYGAKVVVLPDDKFFVAGDYNYASGAARRILARFNPDGTIDTTFEQNSGTTNAFVHFDVFPDGKVILVHANSLIRLKSDGSTDLVYPVVVPQSSARDVKALPDGRTLLTKDTVLQRFNTDGTLDSSFNVSATGLIYKIALQPDGKIMIGGNFEQVNGINRSKIARLNADGTLDVSFNSPSGGINNAVTKIALQSDGKMVIGGAFSGISFNTREGLARLNSDGSLDLGFVPPSAGFNPDDIKIQPDGKVLYAGPFSGCKRLNPNGAVDTSFICTPSVGNSDTPRVRGIAQQSSGKIIVVGDFLRINGVLAPGIARLLNNSDSSFDYDGDGKADVSVFRPSTNRWYIFKSSDSTVTETTFGISGDILSPADYDGDGKTDLSIFRPSTGDWWYSSSINSQQIQFHWGASGDIPRPSDFDSDGKSDFIVFRPSNNTWYRFGSTGAVSIVNFGLAGDKPVTGDFDGDGKSDVAIFRPSTGDWWYQSSLNGAQLATHWGISTDVPAPADFDGDGKTDFAVYRPSTGTWYIINSSNFSFTIMNFGIAEDKPVPADYDGDGKADIAVFRPSTGTWYQMKTTAGFAAQQFGVSTDISTENAFVP